MKNKSNSTLEAEIEESLAESVAEEQSTRERPWYEEM